MIRFAFVGLAMLALTGVVAAEDDNGRALVDLFVRTCALRPALPSEMEHIASEAGFVRDGNPISAEMEAGPRIDILYSAGLTKRGEKVAGLTAYFDGPADGPTVTCTVTAVSVSAEALAGLIEKSLDAHDRTEKAPDDNRRMASWRLGAAEGGGTLDMLARRDPPQRAAITIEYRGRKR